MTSTDYVVAIAPPFESRHCTDETGSPMLGFLPSLSFKEETGLHRQICLAQMGIRLRNATLDGTMMMLQLVRACHRRH